MKRLIFVFLCLGLLGGCKSDPYEGVPAVQAAAPEQKQDPKPEPPPPPPPPPKPLSYTLDAPDVLSFKEGQKAEYQIKAYVPAPGTPVLQFVDLPAGMQFDGSQSKLVWTPGYTDADDPAHPTNEQKVLVIQAQLSSSEDPVTVLVKKMVIIVQNTPHVGPMVLPTLTLQERSVFNLPSSLFEKIAQFEAPQGTVIHARTGQWVALQNQSHCESLIPFSAQESLALQCFNSETGQLETHIGFDLPTDARVAR